MCSKESKMMESSFLMKSHLKISDAAHYANENRKCSRLRQHSMVILVDEREKMIIRFTLYFEKWATCYLPVYIHL